MLLIIESIDFCYEKNSFLAFCFLLYLYLAIYSIQVRLNIWNASQICVPCLCKDHANLLCIIPILVYVLPKQAQACVLTWEGGEDSRHSQTDTISSKNQCVHTFLISSFLKIHFLQHKKSPVFFFFKEQWEGT